jgi:hypothetical protein
MDDPVTRVESAIVIDYDDGTIATRTFPDGRVAIVFRLTFGRARLGVRAATSNPWTFDDAW